MMMRLVCFSICNLTKPSLFEIFAMVVQNVNSGLLYYLHAMPMVVINCHLLITGKYKSPHCFKNVERLPTKYEANTNSWMMIRIF
jgi:hypothetical protein